MLEIEVKLDGEIVAQAACREISGPGEVSDYFVTWNDNAGDGFGNPDDYGKFIIKGNRRGQTAWALVAKTAAAILGQMIGEKP